MNLGSTLVIYKEGDEDNQCELLSNKFDEEVQEFRDDPTIEELADILEVGLTMLDCSLEDVCTMLLKKREQKGRFNEYYVMEIVD